MVPHRHPLPTGRIAARLGWVLVNDNVVDVAELPTGSQQVQSKELLFAADEEALLEAADLKNRRPPHHQSSQSATYGVSNAATPAFRPDAPELPESARQRTLGKRWPSATGVPSVEPLSTTTIRGRSGSDSIRSMVREPSSRRL